MMRFCDKIFRINLGVLALAAVLTALLATPATSGNPQRRVTKSKAAPPRRAVVNFRELARREAAAPRRPTRRRVAPHMRAPIGGRIPIRTAPTSRPSETIRLLPQAPQPLSPAPSAGFGALGDNGTAIPPDTQGTVGPSHLMVALNSEVRIQSKTGSVTSTVSLDSFWASLNSPDTPEPFDPKLAYDHMIGRWIFVATSNKRSATSSLLIATSQTNDPTGTWDLYRVDADDTDTIWADYPSLGFNKNWIVVTYNAFAVADDAFVEARIYAFKKSDLYAGTAATHTFFLDDGASTSCQAITFDNSLATMYLVQTLIGNFDGHRIHRSFHYHGGHRRPGLLFWPIGESHNHQHLG